LFGFIIATGYFSIELYSNKNNKYPNKMSSNIRITKVCEYCKNEFEAKTIATKYCSYTCNKKLIDMQKEKRSCSLQ
jgi:hypothetical protein